MIRMHIFVSLISLVCAPASNTGFKISNTFSDLSTPSVITMSPSTPNKISARNTIQNRSNKLNFLRSKNDLLLLNHNALDRRNAQIVKELAPSKVAGSPGLNLL